MNKIGIDTFGKVLEWVKNYGFWNIIKAGIAFVFIVYMTVLATNPQIIYEKIVEYTKKEHIIDQEERERNTIESQYLLKDLIVETDCDRSWIIEFHNGSQGLGGLPFRFGIMTQEELKPNISSISSLYNDFILSRYPFLIEVCRVGKWIGNVEEIKDRDIKLYYMLKSNDVEELAVSVLKDKDGQSLGLIGITSTLTGKIDESDLTKLRNAAISISILLSNEVL